MRAELGQLVKGGLRNLTFRLGGQEVASRLEALRAREGIAPAEARATLPLALRAKASSAFAPPPASREFVKNKHEPNRRSNEFGVDPFGMDLDYTLAAMGPLFWLYKHYFRVRTYGLSQMPQGRVLLVSNHSGQLPLDGAMIGISLLIEADPPRPIRSMVEKWVPTLPYVSMFMARCGQVVGTPQNCIRLLENEEAILVFPEGTRGVNKLFAQRYQLAPFGQGFMRLALETGTPIVPIAVIGAEEQAPALLDLKPLAKLLKMPSMPITPTILPIPLPVRYHIHFGAPMRFTGRHDDDDSELNGRVNEVRAVIQSMINEGLRQRKSVFW